MELTPEGFQYRIIDPKERLQIRLRSSAQQVWQAWRVFSGNKLALLGLTLLCIYLFHGCSLSIIIGKCLA